MSTLPWAQVPTQSVMVRAWSGWGLPLESTGISDHWAPLMGLPRSSVLVQVTEPLIRVLMTWPRSRVGVASSLPAAGADPSRVLVSVSAEMW